MQKILAKVTYKQHQQQILSHSTKALLNKLKKLQINSSTFQAAIFLKTFAITNDKQKRNSTDNWGVLLEFTQDDWVLNSYIDSQYDDINQVTINVFLIDNLSYSNPTYLTYLKSLDFIKYYQLPLYQPTKSKNNIIIRSIVQAISPQKTHSIKQLEDKNLETDQIYLLSPQSRIKNVSSAIQTNKPYQVRNIDYKMNDQQKKFNMSQIESETKKQGKIFLKAAEQALRTSNNLAIKQAYNNQYYHQNQKKNQLDSQKREKNNKSIRDQDERKERKKPQIVSIQRNPIIKYS